jgi:hypothetical protein
MDARAHERLNKLFLLLVAAAAVLGFEALLFGLVTFADSLPENTLLRGLILLLVCGFVFLCFVGSTVERHVGLSLLSRVVLVLLTVTAVIVSLEIFLLGATGLALAWQNGSWDNEAFWATLEAAALVCLAAAGVKYAFRLRIRYRIVLLAISAVVILLGTLSPLAILFS